MCEICNVKKNIISCKVTIECISYIRDFKGDIEKHPAYSEIQIPINYCPICGKKSGEE